MTRTFTPKDDGEKRRWTQAELTDELIRRFGHSLMDWSFQCPYCGDIASARDFIGLASKGATSKGLLGQECIGRFLGALEIPKAQWKGRGCTYVAYGLIPGPWIVTVPVDGGGTKEIGSFRIAPAPGPKEPLSA